MRLIRRQMALYPDHIRSSSSLSAETVSLTDSQLLEVSLKPNQKLKIDASSLISVGCNANTSSLTHSELNSANPSYMMSLLRLVDYLYLPQISSRLKSLFVHRENNDNSVELLEISNPDREKPLNLAFNPRFPGNVVQFDLEELGSLGFFRPDSFLCGENQVVVDKILFEISGSPGKFVYFHRVHGNGWFFVKGGNCLKKISLSEGTVSKINLKSLLGFYGDIKLVSLGKEYEDLDLIGIKGPGTVLLQAMDHQAKWLKPEDLPRNLRFVTINTSNI